MICIYNSGVVSLSVYNKISDTTPMNTFDCNQSLKRQRTDNMDIPLQIEPNNNDLLEDALQAERDEDEAYRREIMDGNDVGGISNSNGRNKNKRKRQCNVFETDLDTVKLNLEAKKFKLSDNSNGKADFWTNYQVILNENGHRTNFVQCRNCSRFDKYDPKKYGTRLITNHFKSCSEKRTSRETLDAHFTKSITVAAEDKKVLGQAAAKFCAMDIRPFRTIECDGLLHFLTEFANVAGKYGKLDKENVKKLLPCANTVSWKIVLVHIFNMQFDFLNILFSQNFCSKFRLPRHIFFD